MTYAMILNGIVVTVLLIEDINLLPQYSVGYDAAIEIDNLAIQPGINWSYDGNNFSPIISFSVDGGYPSNIPSGTNTTFSPFILSEESGGFNVNINNNILYIGCQSYDYVWARYALWMLLIQNTEQIGCLANISTGVCYNNQFTILTEDITNVYLALITLI